MHVHRADAQLSVARLWAPRAFSAHMHDAYAEPEALTGGCVWREVCLTGIGITFLSKPFRCRTERLYRLILTFELMHRANSHCSVSFPFDPPLCTAWLPRLVCPFLLGPAAALRRHPPWRMKLLCLALVEAPAAGQPGMRRWMLRLML